MNIFLNGQTMRHSCKESGLWCSPKQYLVHDFEYNYHDSLQACLVGVHGHLIITCIMCKILQPPSSEVLSKVIKVIVHVFLKTMFASHIVQHTVQYLGEQTDS